MDVSIRGENKATQTVKIFEENEIEEGEVAVLNSNLGQVDFRIAESVGIDFELVIGGWAPDGEECGSFVGQKLWP